MFCMSELCILVDEKVFIFTYVLLPTLLGYVNVCMSIYECVRRIGLRGDFVCVNILYMPKRIYAMHFIVACLGVCLCDFAYVPGVDCVTSPNPTGFY